MLKQFKLHSQKLNRLLQDEQPGLATQAMAHTLAGHLRELYFQLRKGIGSRRLRRILAGAAIVLGIGGPVRAQVSPSFPTSVTAPFGLNSEASTFGIPLSVDIDGDGDLDVLSSEDIGNWRFYENAGTATQPSLNPAISSPFGLAGPAPSGGAPIPACGDLDGDGDYDILASDNYIGAYYYYENTGTASAPSFAQPLSGAFGLDTLSYITFPYLADIDNDGDLDLFAGRSNGAVRYYENTGSSITPVFAPGQDNPFGLQAGNPLNCLRLGDLDLDGDLDLLSTERYGAYTYWENTGTVSAPAFSSPLTNPFGLTADSDYNIHSLADWDGDGDLDILECEYGGDYEYHENQAPVGNSLSFSFNSFTISPNPSEGAIHISLESESLGAGADIRVYSIEGQLLQQWHAAATGRGLSTAWDASQMPTGMYILEMEVGGRMVRQRFSRM